MDTREHLQQAISGINTKKDLFDFMESSLNSDFKFNEIMLAVVGKDDQRDTIYLLGRQDVEYSFDYDEAHTNYKDLIPYIDTIFETALKQPITMVNVLTEVDKLLLLTGVTDKVEENLYHESALITVKQGNEPIAVFILLSEDNESFEEMDMLIHPSFIEQLGTVTAYIVAKEELRQKENENLLLMAISNDMASVREKSQLLDIISTKLKKLFYYNDISITRYYHEKRMHGAYFVTIDPATALQPDYDKVIQALSPINDGVVDVTLGSQTPIIFKISELLKRDVVSGYITFHGNNGIKEFVGVSMRSGEEIFGGLYIFSDKHNAYPPRQLKLIQGIADQLSISIANIIANEKIVLQLEEINKYKSQLEEEKQYLQEEIGTAYNYAEIVGGSKAMEDVFKLVSKVASEDLTVLVLGETGTGKELITRAIHNASPRREKLMVKVNCAALPSNLIESELFGHEKGSFTGAIDRRIGKFELANEGTLFLDEIGELPLDVQGILLRVIQEKEIERVGGRSSIKVDVRIIAATNRNLEKDVIMGKFRSDLYYRLNVFPILLPPLRDRKEEIPLLSQHFIRKFARKAGKTIVSLSSEALKELTRYDWPGNIREMEHLIERSILMTSGTVIDKIYLPQVEETILSIKGLSHQKNLNEHERDYIIDILKKCNGKISGFGGAAELLDLQPTTLHSKIKKLGIDRKNYQNP